MNLTQWIKKTGGPAKAGKLLNVQRNAIHAWLAGKALPRPDTMQKIVRVSKKSVTYDEMINENRGKRAAHRTKVKKYDIARKRKIKAKKKSKKTVH